MSYPGATVDQSRSDVRHTDDRKPPVMGARQSWRGYRTDLERWALACSLKPTQVSSLVIVRGLSQNPRIEQIANNAPPEVYEDDEPEGILDPAARAAVTRH